MTEESDPEHFAQRREEAMEAAGRESADGMLLYNIGFFVDGTEIEPAAPVTITLQVLKDGIEEGTPVTIVHFGENGTETLDATDVDKDGNTSFTQDSFSDTAVFFGDDDTPVTIANGEDGDTGEGTPGDSDSETNKNDMESLLSHVDIKTEDGKDIGEGGTLYVGEKYKITLTFAEGGAQSAKQFVWNDDGTMTYQLPADFKVEPKPETPLTIELNGEKVEVGIYYVTEDGELVVKLSQKGQQALNKATDAALSFEMDATLQAGEGSDSGHIKFNDAGEDFDFEVVDQARVDVKKEGKYIENDSAEGAMAAGGKLEYTVTTKVERGSIHDLSILDELTPPNTSALEVGEVNHDDIKVTLKKADGTEVELEKDKDYELVEVPDADHPGKKTFQVKLKESSQHGTLNEGDELVVTYPYEVEYVPGTTDVFWGNVANDVHVTGKGKVPPPADDPDKEMPEIDIDEHMGSNVEIIVTPPGDGIIYKTQEFSEADHRLHYTLYTVVPKGGPWSPFYIQDDMVVEFGGEKYYLPEFKKEGGRVSNLQVSTVTVEADNFGEGWSTSDGEQRQQSLEALKNKAENLGSGFDFDKFPDGPYDQAKNPVKNESNQVYDSERMDQWVYQYVDSGNRLDIIFGFKGGKHSEEYEGKWGHWNITDHDTLIITEYDLDMSNDRGPITLQKMDDSKTTLSKEASEVLLAGIRNNVNMRFDGYYPGYSVFFNNADRMNKTGAPIKSDNTIEYTVTMNTTDTSVNKYFRDVNSDMWLQVKGDGTDEHPAYGWGEKNYYPHTMQAVFYDVLPDGWEYVEGSLTATAYNNYKETYYPFKGNDYQETPIIELEGGGKAISAPLVFFYNDNGAVENGGNKELFNVFSEKLEWLTFTYKLKATDEWIRDHATDTNAVTVHNHAEIRDILHEQAHWEADANVPYLPQHLSKTAQQVGDGSDLLRFTLHVNPGNAKLDTKGMGYLIVTDTSQNLKIQKGTIKVTDAGGNSLTQVAYEEGMKLGENQWAIMPETESGQFRLMVPDGKALFVTYDAQIPELGTNVPVSNTAGIEGVVNSSSGITGYYDVDHIEAGGTGSTYTLNFQKVDSTDNAKKLPGAQFKFYIVLDDTKDNSGGGIEDGSENDLTSTDTIKVGDKEYSCYSEVGWIFTTGDDGVYNIPSGWRLAPGNYYILEETEAPEGYEKKGPVLFYFGEKSEIDTESHPGAVAAPQGETLFVEDPPIPYELPETGGEGYTKYIVGGLMLAMAAASLIYIEYIRAERRRRRARSSRKRRGM